MNNNDDLISREALKKAIKDNGYSHYFEIFDIINNAPTVEIPNYGGKVVPDNLQGWKYEERPTGEWEKDEEGRNHEQRY